jgi:hypothetical protein
VPALEQGRIIWAPLPDSSGRSKKRRPDIIVTQTLDIKPDEPIVVVAATTKFAVPAPEDHVLLPWHPQGQVRTGLRKPTAAVCSWLFEIRQTDIESLGGIVPPALMLEIVTKVKERH